jgi:rRNA maturation protein Rpf1
MITKFARLEFELFTRPSHFDEFVKNRIHQMFDFLKFYEILENLIFYKFVNHNASKNYLQVD